jgi:hypothetical protein
VPTGVFVNCVALLTVPEELTWAKGQIAVATIVPVSLGTDGQLQIDAGAVYQQAATGGTSVEIVIVNNGVFTIAQDDLCAIAGASGAGEWIVGTGTNPSTHRKSVHHVQLWWRHF